LEQQVKEIMADLQQTVIHTIRVVVVEVQELLEEMQQQLLEQTLVALEQTLILHGFPQYLL